MFTALGVLTPIQGDYWLTITVIVYCEQRLIRTELREYFPQYILQVDIVFRVRHESLWCFENSCGYSLFLVYLFAVSSGR